MPGHTDALLIGTYFFPVKPVWLWAQRQAICMWLVGRVKEAFVWAGLNGTTLGPHWEKREAGVPVSGCANGASTHGSS